LLDYCTRKVTAQLPSVLWVWNRRLHYLISLSSYCSAAILRFLFIISSMATSSTGANVWHSWHSMHKRNGETEEDSRALSLFAASGTQFTSSCWHVCSGKNSSCNSGSSSLFGTARGSRPSHTTVVHKRLRCLGLVPHWPKRSAKLGVNFFQLCFVQKINRAKQQESKK